MSQQEPRFVAIVTRATAPLPIAYGPFASAYAASQWTTRKEMKSGVYTAYYINLTPPEEEEEKEPDFVCTVIVKGDVHAAVRAAVDHGVLLINPRCCKVLEEPVTTVASVDAKHLEKLVDWYQLLFRDPSAHGRRLKDGVLLFYSDPKEV